MQWDKFLPLAFMFTFPLLAVTIAAMANKHRVEQLEEELKLCREERDGSSAEDNGQGRFDLPFWESQVKSLIERTGAGGACLVLTFGKFTYYMRFGNKQISRALSQRIREMLTEEGVEYEVLDF